MKEILCTLVLIALASAKNSTNQLNSTKEESSLSKRYIVSIPQYNSLLYTNSQVIPTQQLLFGNSQALVNYINSIQLRTAPYGIPNYYILPRNNFIQSYNVVPSIQSNVVPGVLQKTIAQPVLPKQKIPQPIIQQQIVPQVLKQQVVPQQVLKQPSVQQAVPQIFRQQVVPQQVLRQQVVPQLLRQQVIPQQLVPQLFRQQIIPQQIVPQILRQQIIPQQLIPQQIVPAQVLQQLIAQQALRQQIVPQQIVPQPVLKQQVVPQKVVSQPTVPTYYQNNVVTPLIQQRIGPFPDEDLKTPPQQQYYQPEPPRSQVAVGAEPYPYEVPPGQSKIPPTNQVPVYTKVPATVPQIEPVSRVQNLVYSNTNSEIPFSYLQGQVNSQPQPIYGPPYLQTQNDGQQVVRIGYGHGNLNEEEIIDRSQEVNRIEEPHTVYADPNLFSTENNQAVVRIGYGHPHLEHQVGHQTTDNGPQQVKLDLPISYEGEASVYRYESQRPTRKIDGSVNSTIAKETGLIEAERKT